MTHATRTRRFWRRALVCVLLAMVVLPIGWAVVAVWVPYQRTQSAIRYIESVGGQVHSGVILPAWAVHSRFSFLPAKLQTWLNDAERDLFVAPTDVVLQISSIHDADLARLSGLTNLQILFLSQTQVSDAGLVHLGGLTSLSFLDLDYTQVSDAGLVHLRDLTSLSALYLAGTEVSGTGLVHLTGLTKLDVLALQRTKVSDAGLGHLTELTSLEELSLSNTQVSDSGLVHLRNLANLEYLDLQGTQVTAAGVNELQQALPRIIINWTVPAAPQQ